jgi:hypothetical protein
MIKYKLKLTTKVQIIINYNSLRKIYYIQENIFKGLITTLLNKKMYLYLFNYFSIIIY